MAIGVGGGSDDVPTSVLHEIGKWPCVPDIRKYLKSAADTCPRGRDSLDTNSAISSQKRQMVALT